MPSALECILIRKCKVKKNEARKLASLGRERLGTQVEWSTQLEKECIKIHKEREDIKKGDRFYGMSPMLAFKIQQHEEAYNTTVDIRQFHKEHCAPGTSPSELPNPQPTFQESATTKNLPPIARKKAAKKLEKETLSEATSKNKTPIAIIQKESKTRVRSPSPAQNNTNKTKTASIPGKRIKNPSPPPPSEASKVSGKGFATTEKLKTGGTSAKKATKSKSNTARKVRAPSPAQVSGVSRRSSPSILQQKKPSPSPPPSISKSTDFESERDSLASLKSLPRASPSTPLSVSIETDSSTSELSSLNSSLSSLVAAPASLPPPEAPQSPPKVDAAPSKPTESEVSPTVSYNLPGASSNLLESPTKRLAKLATMSMVSPMVRTQKLKLARNTEFSAFEAPLAAPTHGRRPRKRASIRSRRRKGRSASVGSNLSSSIHSHGESSLSSQGSDSIQSYNARGQDYNRKTAISQFIRQVFGDKVVSLLVDNCPGRGPDTGNESDFETPSLLGISDSEYESDAMYESDTLEDFDFFDDNGSVGSANGVMCIDPGNAMLPMPKLEAARPRFSRCSSNPYDSNDEESFSSDDSDEDEDDGLTRMRKKLPARASSFDGYLGTSSSGPRRGKRSAGAREPLQRSTSFDLEDLQGKGRKIDAV